VVVVVVVEQYMEKAIATAPLKYKILLGRWKYKKFLVPPLTSSRKKKVSRNVPKVHDFLAK